MIGAVHLADGCEPVGTGAALGVPLSEVEAQAFDIPQDKGTDLLSICCCLCAVGEFSVLSADAMTPLACAYIRARNADPLCSFGDFAALSDVVDEVRRSAASVG